LDLARCCANPLSRGVFGARRAARPSIFDHYRSEIDKNFKTVAAMLNVQNEQRLRAIRSQKWWNYGLAAAVVLLAIFWIVLFNSLH
jgi:hypothetical protein